MWAEVQNGLRAQALSTSDVCHVLRPAVKRDTYRV